MEIVNSVASKCAEILLEKAMKEVRYLCCYKSYVNDFENEMKGLSATVESVNRKIKEAQKRNETEIDPVVQEWLRKAQEDFMKQDTKPKKLFGLCPNCFSECWRAKKLETKTLKIQDLIQEANNFSQVARAAGPPGMEFYSQEFMPFESRISTFEQLMKELQDENKHRIGLQAMGGSGKTTLAKEVGKQVEKSKSFDEVIFIQVPNPVDEKKIRDGIGRKLELQLKEENPLAHAEQIWTRIANAGKVLVILDDVWEKLNLENIGIQHGIHSKGRCCVLLTTRYVDVCNGMGCQKMIKLDELPEKDAVELFLYHASATGHRCADDLKKVASDIVNECGKLPVIVVAVAKTLRNWQTNEWQDALTALRNDAPLRREIVDENMTKFYNSLSLSYTSLKKEAQVLFLLCSIFPRAYEIPIELLSRITIGLGLFGEVDKYHVARSQVPASKNTLINSSLLLNAGEECVKMHDIISEVALQIASKDVQVIMDCKTRLKEKIKYSTWILSDFSNCFQGSDLEVLFIWINANYALSVPEAFFDNMIRLRVLLLYSASEDQRTPVSSLPKSIQSLTNVRTLSLTNWKLGDISVLSNLQMLETLELTNCSIIELPNEVKELGKLRLLGIRQCSIERKNSFEVIRGCSQLEEMYYVSNEDILKDAKLPHVTTLPEFRRYHIEGRYLLSAPPSFWLKKKNMIPPFQVDASIKRYFNPAKLKGIFSKELIKFMAARAEILVLGEDNETGCTNLIPDIVKDGGMNDLIRLCLERWSEIKCLIHTGDLQSRVTVFSKLVELQLHKMDMRELCCGSYPVDFLKQLEMLNLYKCRKLEGTLFKDELELGNLKSIKLLCCSITCLFHPSTAQSLKQLETLDICDCHELKYIIRDEGSVQEIGDDHDPNQKSHDAMFPKLKFLEVLTCDKLEFILPICSCEDLPLLESVHINHCKNLKYIFGQYPEERCLYQMGKQIILPSLKELTIIAVTKFVNIYPECYLPSPSEVQNTSQTTGDGSKVGDDSSSNSLCWCPLCCVRPQPSAPSINLSQGTQGSKKKYVPNTALGLFTPPLYPYNLKEMRIVCIDLTSLFTLSIASSLVYLERLQVYLCDALEHIVTGEAEGDDDNHKEYTSIFPNLRQIEIHYCHLLECIFPASYSRNFVHLESVEIMWAHKLKYVFGKCHSDDNLPPHQNQNAPIQLDLPTLKRLCLDDVPNIVSICAENYHVKALRLKDIVLKGCPELSI